MLNVREINKNTELTTTKAKKTGGSESFASYLQNVSAKENPAVSASAGIAVADAIFAAQTVNDEEGRERRRQTVKRGFTLLEKLEEIRDALLLGYISKDRLIEISRFVKERKINTEDDKLNEIIAEIELRVEVELAKLTRGTEI